MDTGSGSRMKSFLRLNTLILLFFIFLAPVPCAAQARIPFQAGETLTFQVKWAFVPAGEAVLKVLPMETVQGLNSHHFQMTSKTYEWVDVLYKVRDRIDSFADEAMTRSVSYRKVQEGKSRRDITVDFNWERLEARYSNLGQRHDPIPVQAGSFDPLGVFYSFRLNTLKEDLEFEAPVTDGKKCIQAKAKVLGRERIKGPCGEFDTFLVETSMEQVGGIFEKSKGSKIQIWVSKDPPRIPVRIRSKVTLGSFVADLIAYELGPGR